jgi:hypothetical protein
MIVKALRVGLGQLIIFIDFISRPAKRSATPLRPGRAAAKGLTLYQFHACPFCVKTRRTLHRLNVPVALRDAKNNPGPPDPAGKVRQDQGAVPAH